jgi:plasmid stabilization system protein ParE
MKVVLSDEAIREIDEILQYISEHYPSVYESFEIRLRAIVRRIGQWPDSAQEVLQRPGVRSVPFIRYPYKLFYRVLTDRVEVLHVHHAARSEYDIG